MGPRSRCGRGGCTPCPAPRTFAWRHAMTTDTAFPALIARVRRGDEAAAVELVRRFEPEIRREVRFLLRDPHLRCTLDSMDICQSVLGSFFARAALGEYDLEQP